MYDKQKLIDAVIESLKADILAGDVTVLEELLGFIEKDKLVQSLPEDQWSDHRSSSDYFNIKATGYNPDLQREEIQIHCGVNGNLMIIKTDEGFVVDVYGQNDLLDSTVIWEESLNPNTEDDLPEETYSPDNFSQLDIREFVEEFGQTHEEICIALNYDEADSDDLLMVDHFFEPTFKKWIPKLSSMYDERQEAIANFLRLGDCTYELCPHCEMEVKLKNEFCVQQCPNCRCAILPCSICTHGSDAEHTKPCDCTTCPLEKK